MNLLVVEDEHRVADFVTRGLRSEGWIVEHVDNGEAALERLETTDFDVLLLDLMLPGISGQEVCRKLRARGNVTPILMLTALDAVDERVSGLRLGADDYLAKPFDFDELVARVEALARRAGEYKEHPTRHELHYQGLRVDTRALLVTLDEQPLELTTRERSLLILLISNPGKLLARERILNSVWGSQEDPLTNVVDVYIGRLRKKLGPYGKQIKTVRGAGFRFGTE
ncbi:MAG: response regulator transcription factor [Gammaproteobacteria bacterium]|nr:response regulator transcription factor [Gammaproteobacteria bacterium]